MCSSARYSPGSLHEERTHPDRWVSEHFCAHVQPWLHGPWPDPCTWWCWRGKAFDNDAGWRIDYQFVSAPLARLAT